MSKTRLSGAKAHYLLGFVAARLKSRPDTKLLVKLAFQGL